MAARFGFDYVLCVVVGTLVLLTIGLWSVALTKSKSIPRAPPKKQVSGTLSVADGPQGFSDTIKPQGRFYLSAADAVSAVQYIRAGGNDMNPDVLALLFHADYCMGCQRFKPMVEGAAIELNRAGKKSVNVLGVESAEFEAVCKGLGLKMPTAVPALVAYSRHNAKPHIYDGELTQAGAANFLGSLMSGNARG